MSSSSNLKSGWTFDETSGSTYHFEHISMAQAELKANIRERITVVETINWTFADGDESERHFNQYFSFTLADAVALAARLEISSNDIAEDVVAIRPATEDEIDTYLSVYSHFLHLMPDAISDDQARGLPQE